MAVTELHTYEVVCDGTTCEDRPCTSRVILSCAPGDLVPKLKRQYWWKVLTRHNASETGGDIVNRYLCPGHHSPEESLGMKVAVPQDVSTEGE